MTWMTIRLELGRTSAFPDGSPAHAYMLHLPLDSSGHIDEAAFKAHRERAKVTRLWPNEPDQHGEIIRKRGGGWAISYTPGEEDDESLWHLESHTIVKGEYISITELNERTGKPERLPFKVVSCHSQV